MFSLIYNKLSDKILKIRIFKDFKTLIIESFENIIYKYVIITLIILGLVFVIKSINLTLLIGLVIFLKPYIIGFLSILIIVLIISKFYK